jgi:hypothetical protein
MKIICNIFILLCLILLIYQDFRDRKISFFSIPLLFFLFLIYSSFFIERQELALFFAVNFSFVLLQILLLIIYLSIKKNKLINITKEHLGLGDILFFFVLTIAFSPVNLMLFFVLSLLLTVLFSMAFNLKKANTFHTTIPLAGYMSLFLIPVFTATLFTDNFNLYSNSLLNYFVEL